MNSKANASAGNGAPRRRRRNASDLAMIVVAMVTGGMLSYVLTSFADVPTAHGIGAMTALIAVVGIGVCIIGWLQLFRKPY